MAGTVPVLTYLPIDTYGTTDTVNVPKLDIMRGDITPAVLVNKGSGFEIVNNPTPFYMLCTAKVFNGYTQINTIVKNSILQEAYQQFGVTQGSATYFPGTNSDRSNAQDKRNFFLNTFQNSFLQDATSTSPGLLVPMYCGYNPGYGFYFFRADVFYDSTIPGTNTQLQLPEKPIAYGSPLFPDPIGKKISQFYHFASVYTNSTNDQNRIGTWSTFLTDDDIAFYVSTWRNFQNGPLATKVYIQFNIPTDGQLPIAVTSLSSSEIHTVLNMYQDSNAIMRGGTTANVRLDTYSADSTFVDPIPGYPLNFLYALGGNFYKSMQNINPPVVYQNQDKSYLGNFTQLGSGGWSPSNITYLYQGKYNAVGDNDSFVFQTSYTRGLSTTNTEYKCFCAGNTQYNGLCFANGGADSGISSNGPLVRYTKYYQKACNSINAGTWQFLAYQFIPLNFYNPPPKTLIPQIIPSLSVDNQITFPNKTTGPNQWPTGGLPPNTITNITIADTLYNWIDNPINFFCGNIVNSFPYCGFSDYYLSLMRVFYDKGECGDSYDPPDTSVTPLTIGGKSYFYSNTCTQGLTKGICVPNYQYLLDPTATGTTLAILSGTPQILSNTSVNMIKPNDGIKTSDSESFNTTLKSVYVSMILTSIGNSVFEIGITDEHTTRISQGIITPFGNASSNVAYRSRQLLKIEFLNDIVKTANLYLDGVKIASKIGYTQEANQTLYFEYISASPINAYKFNGIFYGEINGSLIKPFQCLPLTDPVPTDPVSGSTNGVETLRIASLIAPDYYQDVVKDVITWQNLEDYVFSYPQNVVPNNQVNYQPAPALPQNVINALNGNNPTSGSTTPKSASGNLFLIIGIVVAIIVIGLIIFFIIRSNKNRTQEKKIEISPYQYRFVK